MLNYRNIKLISLSIFSICSLVSCTNNKDKLTYQPVSIQGKTQGTTYTIITDDEKIEELQPKVDAILLDFDRCLSTYRDSSIVSFFSKAEPGKYFFRDIKGYFQRCLSLTVEVYKISDGALDPSVYPLVSAWGFMKDPALEMTKLQVDSIKNLIGFVEGVDYDYQTANPKGKRTTENFILTKLRPSLQLDFNSTAQGLAVDVLCEFLDEQGFKNYYVEIGGELRVKGKNKEGALWRIGIDVANEKNAIDPNERQLTAVIAVQNRAVATSGSYRKYYEKNGVKRSHTINPKTGYPVEHSLLSATVVADNAAFADAMATVFMVWGKDKSIDFVTNNRDLNLEILLQFVNSKGKLMVYKSPGLSKMILE